MTPKPTVEDLFRVISQAALGEMDARVALPEELDTEDPATRLGVALNLLLEDLAYRSAQANVRQEALRRAEEQLRQSQKMECMGRLAGGVAHDFNNVLSVILGYGHLALRSVGATDPMRAELEEMVAAAERAAHLTRQLLAFSRQRVVEPRIAQLNDLLGDMETMLKRLVGETVDLRVIAAANLDCVSADVGHLEQVIMNLVVNARDAMPAGGTLLIETANVTLDAEHVRQNVDATIGPHVMLGVRDTGVGFDETIKAHLFEPFFTTKKRGEGTGLGLSTVYGIVTQSGGSLCVHSEPGKGATFQVFLPSALAPAKPPTAFVQPVAGIRGNETILLVEDDDQVRAVVANILRPNGYGILEAGSAEDAVRTADRYDGIIHLLLTDVIMPHDQRSTARRTAPPAAPRHACALRIGVHA